MSDIYTIGHSNRDLGDFLALLHEFGIETVADVRRFPSSRKFPHFNGTNLTASLAEAGIAYLWMADLGGRRKGLPSGESPNAGLDNAGFRNYADYMMTPAFARTANELMDLARRSRTAVMCAERFFWKCHRRLVSDYLTARGDRVIHILGPGETRIHGLSGGVDVQEDGTLIYRPVTAGE